MRTGRVTFFFFMSFLKINNNSVSNRKWEKRRKNVCRTSFNGRLLIPAVCLGVSPLVPVSTWVWCLGNECLSSLHMQCHMAVLVCASSCMTLIYDTFVIKYVCSAICQSCFYGSRRWGCSLRTDLGSRPAWHGPSSSLWSAQSGTPWRGGPW